MTVDAPFRGQINDPDNLLDRIDSILDEAAALPLTQLRRDQVVVWLSRWQQIKARAEGLSLHGLAEAPRTDMRNVVAPGCTVIESVVARTRVDPKALAQDRQLAAWLRRFPLFDDAATRGWLTRPHLLVLRRLDRGHSREHLPEAQSYLLAAARRCSWAQFVQLCQYWRHKFDTRGAEPEAQVEARSLNTRTDPDGMVTGQFTFDPLAGAAFLAALEEHVQRLFRADTEAGSDRSAAQRRADALVDLVTSPPGGGNASTAPLVNVVMSEAVAEDLLQREAADGAGSEEPLPLDPEDVDQRCELIDGTPLHPRFVLALLSVAAFRRMIFGPAGEILDLGRRVRSFPRHLKQALLVRARGRCEVPGCSAPFPWLQADHLIPWYRHGTTAVDNGQILCDPHNKAKGHRLVEPVTLDAQSVSDQAK